MPLYNTLDREALLKRLENEPFARITLSFYRYVHLSDVEALRDKLFADWEQLGILGRIYLSTEGVNAQISIPVPNFQGFHDFSQEIMRHGTGKLDVLQFAGDGRGL